MVPKVNNEVNEDVQTNLQLYLGIALALISFLFIVTVMLVIVSKCRRSRQTTTFGSLSISLYPSSDPRILSMYSDGTLPFPYSYNVCVALDSNDFTYVTSDQNIPVDNLIDSDDSALCSESSNQDMQSNSLIEVSEI